MTGLERRPLGGTGIAVSCLALGGHEYLPDGGLKGFADDFGRAIQPGYSRPDFGGEQRRALVGRALDRGVNYFDATIDPEVEALGRALGSHGSRSADVLVQVRPQGMCYRYDPGNTAMLRPGQLAGEARRLRELLRRDRIDVLNLGIERDALDPVTGNPDYLKVLAEVLAELRADGVVRFVACDTLFSGERQYVALIESGCFDVVWLSLGPLNPAPREVVLPLARRAGLGVVAREAFAKGRLFDLGRAVGVDLGVLAAAALSWVLDHRAVSALAVGVRTVAEFDADADAAGAELSDEGRAVLDQVLATDVARAAVAESERAFRG